VTKSFRLGESLGGLSAVYVVRRCVAIGLGKGMIEEAERRAMSSEDRYSFRVRYYEKDLRSQEKEMNAMSQEDSTAIRTWTEFWRENPGLVTAGIVTTAATGGFLLLPSVLAVAGFTAVGPAAGSIAATWMSSIGVVQAGSLYSGIQSIAMGGAYAATAQGGAAAITGTLAYLGMQGPPPPPEDKPK
jgi:hypothetical protein